ncbi:calcium/sodium antiporter [Pseudooceanicola nitratireducens]|uniref:calcium/sodium antiporter n=1 Tax=Pseudooceanicola nitratireducens TaxID=517719 RepID=UPI001C951A5B|nr:calcium/sodium antiporter [Pseudooceanicola nitratireducens]MBY6165229.1 calcium/sodium antiporter [Pseudooceanicola nitratireducens]
MLTEIWVPLLGGLVLLILGGDFLVRGAVQVAERLGVSPLVIGLTLVGFGTSMPELVTSVRAALSGAPGIAYGNIVGSNIANILLIVGASALVTPVVVARAALRRDAAVMLVVAAAFAALALVVPFGPLVGGGFVLALVAYIWLTIQQERRGAPTGALHDKEVALGAVDPALEPGGRHPAIWTALALALGGLVAILLGGGLLVDGAVTLARTFGISETVIGLTIVAIGTSMPELVTSLVAALRRQGDVAFGNIVGSNIYNILGIGGATALIAPGTVPVEIARFDALVMLGVTLLLVLVAATGLKVDRREGGVLLAGYGIYLFALWP